MLGPSPRMKTRAQRVTAAQALLEETGLSIEAIATRTGLSSAINLRRHFHKTLRTTPAAYRRAFQAEIQAADHPTRRP